MKILSITAGAANMYCGSCLRDNALAGELRRQGHDVILLPLYTPTRTDEENHSHSRVFFGGISVYLQQILPLFRKTPKLLDRLWDLPGVISLFANRGLEVDPGHLGALTVSMLEGVHGRQRKEIDNLTAWLRHEPRPDLVTLPYPLLISLARPLREVTGRPVVCTLQGEELFLEGLIEPHRSRALDLIRGQVDQVDAFIAVSHYGARHMASYLGIPREKIHTVPLGINLDGHAPANRAAGGPRRVGFFSRIAPEKGLHVLAEAFRLLDRRGDLGPIRLEAAGYIAPEHRKYLAGIEAKMAEWGFADRFRYHGEVDRAGKIAFLQSLHVLSVPATYDEPKGIPILEAKANAVPVVQPRRGSFPEMIETTGGGLLVEPDSAEALAEGLAAVLCDNDLAARLGSAGRAGVEAHYTLAKMAERTAKVYARVAAGDSRKLAESFQPN
ncbi:MAG: glycosyltransferase family 4 protein [Bryobacteraceae bacterium]